jgi:hypothetical protein
MCEVLSCCTGYLRRNGVNLIDPASRGQSLVSNTRLRQRNGNALLLTKCTVFTHIALYPVTSLFASPRLTLLTVQYLLARLELLKDSTASEYFPFPFPRGRTLFLPGTSRDRPVLAVGYGGTSSQCHVRNGRPREVGEGGTLLFWTVLIATASRKPIFST